MTVQPPEQPLPRDLPCTHPVRDSDTGCCAVCGTPLPPTREDRP